MRVASYSTPALVQRYSESRRPHPLLDQSGPEGDGTTLTESIEAERELLAPLRSRSGATTVTSWPAERNSRARMRMPGASTPSSLLTKMRMRFPFKRSRHDTGAASG